MKAIAFGMAAGAAIIACAVVFFSRSEIKPAGVVKSILALAPASDMSLPKLWQAHFPNEPGTNEIEVVDSKVLFSCTAAGPHEAIFGYLILKNILMMGAAQRDAKPYAVFLAVVKLEGKQSEALVGVKDLFFVSLLMGKTVVELAPEVLADLSKKGCEIPKDLGDKAKLAAEMTLRN